MCGLRNDLYGDVVIINVGANVPKIEPLGGFLYEVVGRGGGGGWWFFGDFTDFSDNGYLSSDTNYAIIFTINTLAGYWVFFFQVRLVKLFSRLCI